MQGVFHQLDNNSSAGADEVRISCEVLDWPFTACSLQCAGYPLIPYSSQAHQGYLFTHFHSINYNLIYLYLPHDSRNE